MQRISTLIYVCYVIVAWQLVYLADRVLPIPDVLVTLLPIIGLAALPLLRRRNYSMSALLSWRVGQNVADAGLDGGRATYTMRRNAGALVVVLFAIGVSIARGPVLTCERDRPADCGHYVKMVDSIAYDETHVQGEAGLWPEYGSHHFMRVIPPLMVRGIRYLGVDIDVGFRIVSAGAYAVFGLLLFGSLSWLSRNPVLALAFTVLILGAHRIMTLPLRDVYQATDALAYPLSLAIILLALANRWRWLVILAIAGTLTRQNLFLLSTLAFAYLWFRNEDRSAKTEIAALALLSAACYAGLSHYYNATGTVARHFVPQAGPGLFSNTIGRALTQGLLDLFLPLVPFVLWYGRDAARFLMRHWFVGAYLVITLTQPILSYTTGGNLQRVAMHGVWPIYMAVALVACARSVPQSMHVLTLAYAISIYAHPHLAERLAVVGLGFIAMAVVWLQAGSTREAHRIRGPASRRVPARLPDS